LSSVLVCERLKNSKRFNSSGITFFVLGLSWFYFVHVAACLFFVLGSYEYRVSPNTANWIVNNPVGVPPGTSLLNVSIAHQYAVSFYVTALTLVKKKSLESTKNDTAEKVGQPPALFTAAETVFNLFVGMSKNL
jgi:hypothetical protein